MSLYARDTGVPVERSRAEIEQVLTRYGASSFGYMTDRLRAVVQFQASERRIRFILPLTDPGRPDVKFHLYRGEVTDRERTATQVQSIVDQENRQRWRALGLAIKAKLEAVQSGITTFEDEFMAHIMLPGGKTVSEMASPVIESAYKSGKVPTMLGWDGGK